jgi:anti-anti-sigma factor
MRVAGTLDGSTADALDAALRDATPHTSHLDLDLQLVERVDAEGVARLLAAHDLVTGAGVTFRVIGASRTLLRALEARGIAAFLHVAD